MPADRGLCAAALVWRCVLVFNMHMGATRIYLATDTRVDSILFGCALAVWNNPALDTGAAEDSAWPPDRWKYLVLPAALGALLWSFTFTGPISTARLWPQSHAWQRAAVALAASFITSWAIYVAIEKPCARLRKKLTKQQAQTFVPEAKSAG